MNFFGSQIEFNHPGWVQGGGMGLAILFVLVVCVFGFLSFLALRNSYAKKENLDRTTRAFSFAGAMAKTVVMGLIAVLLCIAAADPYEPNSATIVPEGTLQIGAAFDVSPSMGAEDYRDVLPIETLPNGTKVQPVGPWGSRLMIAKHLFVNQVMKQLPGNEISLATFTAAPWPQWPVADDYGTVRFILTDTGWMGIGSAPGGGSDFIQGMKMAIRQLKLNYDPVTGKFLYDPNKRHVIFLFTDGGLEFDDEREKAEWEKEYKLVVEEAKSIKAEVIIVGIGSDQQQLVPIYHPMTLERVDWWPFRKEPKEKTAIDEQQLIKFKDRLISAGLDARYVRIPTEGEAQLNVDWIGTIGGTKVSTGKRSLLQYPLGVAIALFVLLIGRGLWRKSYEAPARPRMTR